MLNTGCWQEAAGGRLGWISDPPLSKWQRLGWYLEGSRFACLVFRTSNGFPVSKPGCFWVPSLSLPHGERRIWDPPETSASSFLPAPSVNQLTIFFGGGSTHIWSRFQGGYQFFTGLAPLHSPVVNSDRSLRFVMLQNTYNYADISWVSAQICDPTIRSIFLHWIPEEDKMKVTAICLIACLSLALAQAEVAGEGKWMVHKAVQNELCGLSKTKFQKVRGGRWKTHTMKTIQFILDAAV